MGRSTIEERLFENGRKLEALKSDLAVAEEQLDHLNDVSEEERVKALVADSPMAERDFRDALRHTEAMRKHRDRLRSDIADIDRLQDQLLDDYTASMD